MLVLVALLGWEGACLQGAQLLQGKQPHACSCRTDYVPLPVASPDLQR